MARMEQAKTTTFYMIVGLIRPNGGKIFLDSTDITKLAMLQACALRYRLLTSQRLQSLRQMSIEEQYSRCPPNDQAHQKGTSQKKR